MKAARIRFDDLPFALAAPTIRESWLRIAASAYRRPHVSLAEINRRYVIDGEVTYLASGECFEIIEPDPFCQFQDEMFAQIAKAFGGRVK